MSTKASNRSGSQTEGAFGDSHKTDKQQFQTHTDDDSPINVGSDGTKKDPVTDAKQSSMDNDRPIDRKND